MFHLMNELQLMAENNSISQDKQRNCTPFDTILAASSIYSHLFRCPEQKEHIKATVQIVYMTGWAPHDSQPKPLPRGSAQLSLQHLGKLIQDPPHSPSNN
eukprot:TRINITY_DN2620_c3_g1_i3.p1 TRINITY_DN2620_c3_g1~~TRINITY_DN2620_c3_g1_i3.p1  ORF type:complete len:100 (+),score=35.82 TRINITY_DN2620_c3_g1_i3:491-790(+)